MTNLSYPDNMEDGISQNHRVFISYSHKDSEVAADLQRLCDQAGMDTWIDKDIKVDENFRDQIEQAINESDVFLILLSDNALNSNAIYDDWSSILERSWKDPKVRLITIRHLEWTVLPKQSLPQNTQFMIFADAKKAFPCSLNIDFDSNLANCFS